MVYRLVGPALLAGALSLPAAAYAQTPPAAPVQAIWKTQQIRFHLQSFTTFYSCDGLESKLKRILQALGTRAKVSVRSAECPSAVVQSPRVVIEVTSPVEATPAALAQREEGKSRRELVARVRGEQAEDSAALAPFAAQWRAVSLSRGELNLLPGDCELIEELRRKVLPKLAVRIVRDELHCTPHQTSLGQPQLHVEALVEAPKPDDTQSPR